MDHGYTYLPCPPRATLLTYIYGHLGHATSQLAIAHHLWKSGRTHRAIPWARAASRELPAAGLFLASLLTTVRPTDQGNSAEALTVVSTLASAGHAEAQQVLASYYFNGSFVKKNLQEARRWAAASAANGRPGCWDELLDNLLVSGEDAPNIAEAIGYSAIALDAGYPQFHNRLQEFIRSRNGV
jgi:TPR repeat protein